MAPAEVDEIVMEVTMVRQAALFLTGEAPGQHTDDEQGRLAALHDYGILDTPAEQGFDDLVELAAAVCQAPIATIALVDQTRAWFKARRGIDLEEVPRDFSLAAEAILQDDVFVVADARADKHHMRSKAAEVGIRFFAGAPLLTHEGHRIGAICVLDERVRELSPTQVDALRAIARQVMMQLELRRVSHAEDLARRQFRTLVEQLPGATYIEELGASSASYMSPQIESLTGYTAEEWSSQEDFFAQVLHPEDRDRVLGAFAASHNCYGPIQIEYRLVAKDGRIVWVHDDAAVARDEDDRPIYLQGYMADVTRRKKSELRLREAQERYRALAEQLPLVTYVDRPLGGSRYVSPQIEALVGYAPHECLSDDNMFAKLVHPDDRETVFEQTRRSKRDGTPLELEYRLLRRDGAVIWVRDAAVPVRDDAGSTRHWQGYLVDITERRAIAEERDQLLEREREQNERLRELDRLKDEFVALVSHELRTPLTSIRGYLELLLEDRDELSAQSQQYLGVVDRSAERLLRLVGDLLFVAQVDAGKLTLKWGEVELEAVVSDCIEAAQPAAAQAGIVLAADCEQVGAIPGDLARLAQLLDNLVSNAIKFTPSGGRVTVRAERRNDAILIEVKDTGIGIPEREQQHLFERFFRARRASEQAIAGTGLGLSIAEAIVNAHGGRISVASREGVGTTFCIELPALRHQLDKQSV